MDKRINSLTDSVNVTIHASKLANASGSYARVQRNTAYIGNIVERISKNAAVPGGTETLLYVAGLLRDGIISFLTEGKAVDLLEMGTLYLKPTKGMESANPEISDVPKMTLGFTPSTIALDAVKDITVGADITKSNEPVPRYLLDLHTNTSGQDITSGYTARVTGTGLKVAGTNSGVFLAPCDDEGVYQMDGSDWVSVCDSETLIDNTSTRLEFNIPADTTAGTYRLIVKTASGSGNRVNKTLRTGMMEEVITVTTA